MSKKGSQLHPVGQSSSPNAGASAQTCLCPSFPSQPPWKHQALPSCLKRPLGSHPRHSQALGKALSSCLIPGGPTTSAVTGPVVEPSLFLNPLVFLCALAAPRCLQAFPRLLPPGDCLISKSIPVSSPLPLEMLPEGTSHLVCSLFLTRAVAYCGTIPPPE